MSDEIMRKEEKKQSPPPGAYNLPAPKGKHIAKQTEQQRLLVTEAQWKGFQAPGAKYDQFSGFKLTKPRPFVLKILPNKIKAQDMYKI